MKLGFTEYKKKVEGCWVGKNIGGVVGAPFEGFRQINNVEYYTQDLSNGPPPNDDLDLQLIWLNAVEKYGRSVNASILAEYWLTFVVPDWAEYGVGKNNLRGGFMPPLSGSISNSFGNSCGCFIRSEIWACLAPGIPELAASYAYEDAIVDHKEEGVYAEIFVAAVQSAAFVESDKYKLIDIGLSYIPEDCGVAKGVRLVTKAYKEGKSWQEARAELLKAHPGTFGVQRTLLKDIPDDGIALDNPGYDAPSNVGIVIIGWLYGEDDFGKSLCIAVNCGEDTDCTAATLGAIFGIIGGGDSIPSKWRDPVGDKINSFCINETNGGLCIPRTVEDLTNRIVSLAPAFLGKYCDILSSTDKYEINTYEGETLYASCGNEFIPETCCCAFDKIRVCDLLARGDNTVHFDFPVFKVDLCYIDGPFIKVGETKKIRITVSESCKINGNNNQWVEFKWYLPEGVSVSPCKELAFPIKATYLNKKELEFEFSFENIGSEVDLVADISIRGRHSYGLIKAKLVVDI